MKKIIILLLIAINAIAQDSTFKPTTSTNQVCFTLTGQTDVLRGYISNGFLVGYPKTQGFTLVECPEYQIECIESQEWTYGIDNTGTDYAWPAAEYVIQLSDGSSLTFNQTTASNGGWTQQLTEWAASIQSAADNAGLNWLVEPRFVSSDPNNLSGGGGLPSPPSVNIAKELYLGGMRGRYVNIQICPAQPVPISASVVSHSNSPRLNGIYDNNGRVGYDLVTAGAILGDINKFYVCRSCGEVPIWYLEDGVTLATLGQIPFCKEPCGTLSLLPPPPDRSCEFFVETACDRNNSENTAGFIQGIIRKVTYCEGKPAFVEYYTTDPNDPTAFVDYELVDAFVDCTTGQIIDEPQPECDMTTYVGNLWVLENYTEGYNVDWWAPADYGGIGTSSAAPHGNVSSIFTSNGTTLTHVNGAPDVSFIYNSSNLNTNNPDFLAIVGASSTQTSGFDQLRTYRYVAFPQDVVISDINSNIGERGGVWVNECCSSGLNLVSERTSETNNANPGVFNNVTIPAGIHYIEMATSDLSAFQGMQLSYSIDDGVTQIPLIGSTTKPRYTCIPVLRCEVSGNLINGETGELITVGEFDSWCEPKGCQESGGGGEVTVEFPKITDIEETAICIGGTVDGVRVKTVYNDSSIEVTYENTTGVIPTPTSWAYGQCPEQCDCKGANEILSISGTQSITLTGGTYCSYHFTVLSGSVRIVEGNSPPFVLPSGTSEGDTYRDACYFLQEDVVIRGQTANTQVIISVIR